MYLRFADHAPLVEPGPNVVIYNLDANTGFETFSTQVHNIISQQGREVFYVFDCLSDLLKRLGDGPDDRQLFYDYLSLLV